MKFVLRFFILDISEGIRVPRTLIQQCKFVMQQQWDIGIERFAQLKEQGRYPAIKFRPRPSNFESIPDHMVFANVNEFFSFQTYNSHMLDTLKYLASTFEE
jgi:hypothetical protein